MAKEVGPGTQLLGRGAEKCRPSATAPLSQRNTVGLRICKSRHLGLESANSWCRLDGGEGGIQDK
jgi:hypothetical protein